MSNRSEVFHENVADLNDGISDFNSFALDHGHTDEFTPIQFVGTPNPRDGEEMLIEHWDKFLEYSREVLNLDSVSKEEALGHIDAINLAYKQTLSSVQ